MNFQILLFNNRVLNKVRHKIKCKTDYIKPTFFSEILMANLIIAKNENITNSLFTIFDEDSRM